MICIRCSSIRVTILSRDTATPTHHCHECKHTWGLGWEIHRDVGYAFGYLFGNVWEEMDKYPYPKKGSR